MGITASSAQAVTTIASGGVMALTTLLLLGLFFRRTAPPKGALWVAIAVIFIGAVVQLLPTIFLMNMAPHVSVTLTPTTSSLANMLQLLHSEPIQARPILWLETSDPKCVADTPEYDPKFLDCPHFSRKYLLTSSDVNVHVYVDNVMNELQARIDKISSDKILRLSAAQVAISKSFLHASAPGVPAQAPVGEDTTK